MSYLLFAIENKGICYVKLEVFAFHRITILFRLVEILSYIYLLVLPFEEGFLPFGLFTQAVKRVEF